jgi:hypothetical protein
MADTPKEQGLVAKAAEGYTAQTTLRALVQAIPYVGGSIDTLFAGKGQKIQQARIEQFLKELDERVRLLPTVAAEIPQDQLLDLMIGAFDKAVRTRSEHKRARFAQIVSRQVQQGGVVDDAEMALRIVAELEDIHVEVLLAAIFAPIVPALFDGLRVVTISEKPFATPGGTTSLQLQKAFPDVPIKTLRLVCSELVAKALLRDDGIGRWDTKGMEYFVPTDLAGWLYGWITKSPPPSNKRPQSNAPQAART